MVEQEKAFQYWLQGAAKDFEAFEKIFRDAKVYPQALFFGHLALEKLLKAGFVKQKRQPAPLTHELLFLAEQIGLALSPDQRLALKEVERFNISVRYPENIAAIESEFTAEFAAEWHAKISELYHHLWNTIAPSM